MGGEGEEDIFHDAWGSVGEGKEQFEGVVDFLTELAGVDGIPELVEDVPVFREDGIGGAEAVEIGNIFI